MNYKTNLKRMITARAYGAEKVPTVGPNKVLSGGGVCAVCRDHLTAAVSSFMSSGIACCVISC